MKNIFILLILFPFFVFSQYKKEVAHQKALEAIELMDNGQYEKSIALLDECIKLDPDNIYTYVYEKSFAYYLKGDYKKSIKVLKKVRNSPDITDQYYQALGNNYDMLGNPKKAIKTYEEGLKKFPSSGPLYLEMGVVYQSMGELDKAMEAHLKGVEVAPKHPSNYYRLSAIFLQNDKNIVPGLIYGEIFLNLEYNSPRAQELSYILYEMYKNAIIFENDTTIRIDFCDVVINVDETTNIEELKLPFCAVFGYCFINGAVQVEGFDLERFAIMRKSFLDKYFEEYAEKYPNFLLDYLKEIDDAGYFEVYNMYLFRMGSYDEFKNYLETYEDEFDEFADWFVLSENQINPTFKNRYRHDE